VAGLIKELLTFGAAGRVEVAELGYQKLLREAQDVATRVERCRGDAKVAFDDLVELKKACVPDLTRVREISKNLSARQRQFSAEAVEEEPPAISLARVEKTLNAAHVAVSAAQGAAAGASTAIGAWALAGTFASASTGTALAGLTGAAAQSATLAWFGGGSIATGGLGVAGGVATLSAIVALPGLAVMAAFAHNRANKDICRYEEEMLKLQDAIDDWLKLELVIGIAERRAIELITVLAKSREAFLHQYAATYRRLFPWRWLSKAWRWLRKLFGASFFTPSEVVDVQRLLQVAAEFAKVIDQRVFESDGSVKETTS